MLPPLWSTSRAPATIFFRGSITRPQRSLSTLRSLPRGKTTPDSLASWWPTFAARDWLPAGLLSRFQLMFPPRPSLPGAMTINKNAHRTSPDMREGRAGWGAGILVPTKSGAWLEVRSPELSLSRDVCHSKSTTAADCQSTGTINRVALRCTQVYAYLGLIVGGSKLAVTDAAGQRTARSRLQMRRHPCGSR